jgi:hypothetical protein
MHHVEGAQCGLPLIYHIDGGGIVEAGRKYGVGFKDDLAGAIGEMRDNWSRFRTDVFNQLPSGDTMCIECSKVVQMLLSDF